MYIELLSKCGKKEFDEQPQPAPVNLSTFSNFIKDMNDNSQSNYMNGFGKKSFNDIKTVNDDIPIVILGHNKDDCFENILTNISYKNKYENLKGVEYTTIIDNINFIRPFMNIDKKEIYNFANIHNLPYLQNSTPDWCQRGKIRASVVPTLEKWDNRIIDGLFNLSDILKDFHISLKLNIKNFKESDKLNIELLNTSILYWKYGIFELYKFYPSNKSLNSLIERLKLWKNKYDTVDIHKITKILINNRY
jgi:tRNA(Ile)-lysidine synthase TilS/MesJ